jgi:hypothetical protein
VDLRGWRLNGRQPFLLRQRFRQIEPALKTDSKKHGRLAMETFEESCPPPDARKQSGQICKGKGWLRKED